MREFEIGDKVKVRKSSPYVLIRNGVGTVVKVDKEKTYPIIVDYPDIEMMYCYKEEEIGLVKRE